MESINRKLAGARRLFVFALIVFVTLSAFAPLQQEPAADSILDRILIIATGFGALVGVSGAVTMLVSFLRAVNWIKTDEQAGKAIAGLNLAAFVILVLFGVFRPDLSLDFLDSVASKIAAIGLFVLGFILQMIIPAPVLRLFYEARVPILGPTGQRVALRAHYVQPTEPAENWTADPKDARAYKDSKG